MITHFSPSMCLPQLLMFFLVILGLVVSATATSLLEEVNKPLLGHAVGIKIFMKTATTHENYSFQDFLRDFDKVYMDPVEYEHRHAIFKQNLAIIHDHNNKVILDVNQKKGGHVLGVNIMMDLLPHELPRGYQKDQSSNRLSSSSSSSSPSFKREIRQRQLKSDGYRKLLELITIDPVQDLPDTVDWRAKGVTTAVKSQGGCGSCWAFASTAVLESHIAIRTGKLYDLSEQELVSCAPNDKHCGGDGGCTGSTGEIAFDFVQQYGIVQEWDFGYQSYHGDQVNCTLKQESKRSSVLRGSMGHDSNKTFFRGAVASISDYAALPSNDYNALMNVVAKLGPVAVSVACRPWQFYAKGVFYKPFNETGPEGTDIDHLVVLEGYGTDDITGENYWLVRNSWSPNWGENGYIRLRRMDPSTLVDPESDCGMDVTPADGNACSKDDNGNDIVPAAQKICGNSGILSDTAIPLGGFLL